jgi:hypothetical protein
MKKINHESLQFISGGNTEYHKVTNPILASAAQVSTRTRDMTPRNDVCSEATSHCNQYSPKTVTPKNGDINSLGQQYSWGTWWDDIN